MHITTGDKDSSIFMNIFIRIWTSKIIFLIICRPKIYPQTNLKKLSWPWERPSHGFGLEVAASTPVKALKAVYNVGLFFRQQLPFTHRPSWMRMAITGRIRPRPELCTCMRGRELAIGVGLCRFYLIFDKKYSCLTVPSSSHIQSAFMKEYPHLYMH